MAQNNLFKLDETDDFSDYHPIFVGSIPDGEYFSEIKNVDNLDDDSSAFISVFYEFKSKNGSIYHLTVRYYSDSKWWTEFRKTLISYRFHSIDEIVGLREIVKISEPVDGGKYMEIVNRHREEEKSSGLSAIRAAHIGAASAKRSSLSKNFVHNDVEDADDFENEEDFEENIEEI